MVTSGTRISARLQPVAATLATAQGPAQGSAQVSSTDPTQRRTRTPRKASSATTTTTTTTTTTATTGVVKPRENTRTTNTPATKATRQSLSPEKTVVLPIKRKKQARDNPSTQKNKTTRSARSSSLLTSAEEADLDLTPKSPEELEVTSGEEECGTIQPRFLGYRATNPLHLHEIRINVARFLSRSDIRNCLLVSEAWWESFAPFLWIDLRPVYRNVLGGSNDYPSHRSMRKNGHLIRTFEYNGHGSVLLSMIPADRIYGTYTDDIIDWRKTEEEEAEEASWMYVDEDLETETPINPNETLSEFEKRIEAKRIERQAELIRLKDVRAANRRQNEVSRFLNDNTDYRSRLCDQIEKLIFSEKRFSRERGCYYRNWIKLIQINQAHLRSLEFTFGIKAFDAYRDIFNQIVLLERLSELTLVDNDLDAQKVSPFLETVCPRLSKLELRNVRIEHGAFPGQTGQPTTDCQIPLMEKMKSVTMIKVHARSNHFSLMFLKQCPNLVELVFRPQWGLSVQEFVATLSEKLPKVTHLSFRIHNMSDMDAFSVIKAVKEAQKLDLSGSSFGLMSTNHLSIKHQLTISYLDIRACSHLTGSMIQRILGECRYLRFFMADQIRAKDVVNNSVYENWACIGLKELTLDFRGDPNDSVTNLKIYRQLAQLTCLESLDITRTISNTSTQTHEFATNCLTLGLKSGLKELRTLVHLNKLVYRGITNGDVGVVELQWMAKAWPQLTQIGGKLKPRKLTHYNPNVHPKEDEIMETTSTQVVGGGFGADGNNSIRGGISGSSSSTSNSISSTAATVASSSSSSFSSQLSSNTSNASITNGYPISVSHQQFQSAQRAQNMRKNKGQQVPPNLMALELKRLNLHHRIKVIPHLEDKIQSDQRKRNRYLMGDSSDEDQERLRPGQNDPRYRTDLRDWI
ncbi:hypothetical protein BGZ79_003481 [Entomortierella chlamydospora]|nr:hypothetical protein BGZ79_003481 [Entomortierella chlamydospora]